MPQTTRFETLAKSGYVARGVVFLLISGLALFSGVAGENSDSKSALTTLLEQPFGRIWVGLIGLGLFGFVAWRLAQSLLDSDGHGSNARGRITRAALFASAVTYFSLAVYALGHAVGMGSGTGGSGERSAAEWIMSQPFGPYIAIAVGLGFVVGGGITAAKGILRKFERYLHIPARQTATTWICVYGLVARGVVFATTGLLFIYAGIEVDANQAGSMADALQWLRRLPFGSVIYVLIAAGLAAFGIYNLVEARYRIVRGPDLSEMKDALPKLP
jgi:hypothetical protein